MLRFCSYGQSSDSKISCKKKHRISQRHEPATLCAVRMARVKSVEKFLVIGSQWVDPIISSPGDKVADQVDDTDPWPLAGI